MEGYGRIPDAHRFVCAGGAHLRSVPVPANFQHRIFVSLQQRGVLALSVHVPSAYIRIHARRRQVLSIGGESHRKHGVLCVHSSLHSNHLVTDQFQVRRLQTGCAGRFIHIFLSVSDNTEISHFYNDSHVSFHIGNHQISGRCGLVVLAHSTTRDQKLFPT